MAAPSPGAKDGCMPGNSVAQARSHSFIATASQDQGS